MKTLCIYVIYDKQNKVNPYIGHVLRELKRFVTDIVVVCNFEKILSGEEYVIPYAKEIYYRQNIGFDAGAYKDALINLLTWEKVLSYDELLLTNDTYFGPIYPFDDMFQIMKVETCDFWGITKHPRKKTKNMFLDEHIQSYFLFFNQNLFHSRYFRIFWEDYEYQDNRDETILTFEIGINKYLTANGYKGLAYMNCCLNQFICKGDENPYEQYIYELISENEIPIIKKTNFCHNNPWLLRTYEVREFIDKYTDYNIELIDNYVTEYRYKGLMGPYYDYVKMEEFVMSHSNIYIYGAGVWGKNVADYFEKKEWHYKGFVVTESNKDTIMSFSEIELQKDDGIIIAQEFKSVCEEIVSYIGERCSKNQIFTPCYP